MPDEKQNPDELIETDNGPKEGDALHGDQSANPVYLDPAEEVETDA